MEISDILNLDDKDKVDEVSGEVTQVYDRTKSKPGSRKKWTVQNFMLYDGTDEIKVAAWNMEDLSELEGQNVTLKRDLLFKDDGEYQSLSMGKNTKLIEDGAAESPNPARKSTSREKRKTAPEKSRTETKDEGMRWGACLKAAATVFTGKGVDSHPSAIIGLARDLYEAQPGSPAQDKVRKLSRHHSEDEEERATGKTVRTPEPEPEPDPELLDEGDEDEIPF